MVDAALHTSGERPITSATTTSAAACYCKYTGRGLSSASQHSVPTGSRAVATCEPRLCSDLRLCFHDPSFIHHPTEWVIIARFKERKRKENKKKKNRKPALKKVSSW